MNFALETWGKPLIAHAWEDFWVYDDVPEDLPSTPEFDAMFMPWFVLGFIPDPEADEARDDWPAQPIGLEWLTTQSVVSDLDRAFIAAACRSPLSVLVVEHVTPQRSLDLKDVLTGKRFHVLEQRVAASPAGQSAFHARGHARRRRYHVWRLSVHRPARVAYTSSTGANACFEGGS